MGGWRRGTPPPDHTFLASNEPSAVVPSDESVLQPKPSDDDLERVSEQLRDEVGRARDRLADRLNLLQERSFAPRRDGKS